tara:strand:- start:544 stop:990 length:447 start_codon:yes stop_codon:yes gene_type:complete
LLSHWWVLSAAICKSCDRYPSGLHVGRDKAIREHEKKSLSGMQSLLFFPSFPFQHPYWESNIISALELIFSSLLQLAKVLQNLANNVEFGGVKEFFMSPLNVVLDSNKNRVNDFLEKLTNVTDLGKHLNVRLSSGFWDLFFFLPTITC